MIDCQKKDCKYIRIEKLEHKATPSYLEWFLILSASFMPFTALRTIGVIGPSEFLLLIVFFSLLWKKGLILDVGNTFVSKYYWSYFVACCVGTVWNVLRSVIYNVQISGTINGIIFDCLSYAFVLIALLTFEMYEKSEYNFIGSEGILRYIVIINSITMTTLFLISRFYNVLGGFQLMYADTYFAPLASNLHHTSMYLLPLAFMAIYIGENQNYFSAKLFFYVYAVFFMYLAHATGSTKANIGIALGVIVSIIFKISSKKGFFSKESQITIIFFLLIMGLYSLLNTKEVTKSIVTFFVENDMGSSRQDLWRLSIDRWLESPVFGYGFGAHISYVQTHFSDAHNTILTTLVQAGLVGMVIFSYLWLKLLKETSKNGYLLASNVALSSYMFGGDILRRLPCWVFIVISVFIVFKINNDSDEI